MASRIKGITIEIGADAYGLEKALESINKNLRYSQAQLNDVNRLLKLDPGNFDLLRQQQRLYAESVEKTREKLDELRKAEEAAAKMLGEGKIKQEQFEALQREVVATEKNLERLQKRAKECDAALEKIDGESLGKVEKLARKAGDALDKAGAKAKQLGDKLSKAGKATSTVSKAAAGILGGGSVLVTSTAEESADFAKLETNAKKAGASLDMVYEAYHRFYVLTQESDSSIEAVSNLLKAGYVDEALLDMVKELSGAVIQFPDTLKIESLSDGLQETLATGKAVGQFGELLDRLGIGAESLNTKMEQVESQTERMNEAFSVLSKEGLSDVTDSYYEENAELIAMLRAQSEYNISMIGLANALRPVATDLLLELTKLLKEVTGFLKETDKETLKMIVAALAATSALSPLLMTLGGLSSALGGAMQWLPKIGPALAKAGTFASGALPALKAVGAFFLSLPGALVAAAVGVALFGDEIQAELGKTDAFLQDIFLKDWTESFGEAGEILNGFFAGQENLWNGFKMILDGVIDFIRGVVTGDWSRAWDGLVQVVDGALQLMQSISQGMGNVVIGVFNWLIGEANKILADLNTIKLPDFLGGKQLFDFGQLSKLSYLEPVQLTNSASRDSGVGSYRVSETSGRASGGGTVTVNNYNQINAENLAQVARLEQVLNGQRQSLRMGYAGR